MLVLTAIKDKFMEVVVVLLPMLDVGCDINVGLLKGASENQLTFKVRV